MVITPETTYESTLEGFEETIKLADQELWR